MVLGCLGDVAGLGARLLARVARLRVLYGHCSESARPRLGRRCLEHLLIGIERPFGRRPWSRGWAI